MILREFPYRHHAFNGYRDSFSAVTLRTSFD
jgi:hypothetical protein